VCPTGIMDLVEICGKTDGRFNYPEEIHCVSLFFCALCKDRCWWFGVPLVSAKTKYFGIRVTDSVILSRRQTRRGHFFKNLVHIQGHDSAKLV